MRSILHHFSSSQWLIYELIFIKIQWGILIAIKIKSVLAFFFKQVSTFHPTSNVFIDFVVSVMNLDLKQCWEKWRETQVEIDTPVNYIDVRLQISSHANLYVSYFSLLSFRCQRHQKLTQCGNSLQFERNKWCEQQTLSECARHMDNLSD